MRETRCGDQISDPSPAAWHEAGHVVARWLCGWPATKVTAGRHGTGFTAGDVRRVRVQDNLRVTLAGSAAEIRCYCPLIDWERPNFDDWDGLIDWERSHFDDWGEARHILATASWLIPPSANLEEAFKRHFRAI